MAVDNSVFLTGIKHTEKGFSKKKVTNLIFLIVTVKNGIQLLLYLEVNNSLYLRSQCWQNQYLI